jgi:hypothetical protein
MTEESATTRGGDHSAESAEGEQSRETVSTGRPGGDDSDPPQVTPEANPPTEAPPPNDEFDWRGWVLVGAVVVSFLVIPWAIILLPRAEGLVTSLGLGLRDAYLVLPLVPAIGLGTLAVWAAVASRRDSSE